MRKCGPVIGTIRSALRAGEDIVAWIPAVSPGVLRSDDAIAGVLALTTERIVFHGLRSNARDHAFPLNSVIAVDLKRRMSGELSFITSTGSMRFDVNGLVGSRWLSAANSQMRRVAPGTARAVPAGSAQYALH